MQYVIVFVLGLVSIARLLIWREHRRSRLLTIGMISVTIGYSIQLPEIRNAIDSHTSSITANLADLGHVVVMAVCWWAFGVVSLRVIDKRAGHATQQPANEYSDQHRTFRRYWSLLCMVLGAALIAAWTTGDHPAGENRAVAWVYGIDQLLAAALVTTAAVVGLADRRGPWFLVLPILVLGIAGIGHSIAVALGATSLATTAANTGLGIVAAVGAAGVATSAYRAYRGRS